MMLLDLIRSVLVILLTLCLTLDYPLALNSFIKDTSGFGSSDELSAGSPWIDSDLPENVTISSPEDPSEDFHLYAGRDLILQKKYVDGYYVWNNYAEAHEVVEKRAMELLKDREIKGHDAELLYDMYDLLLDWDERDKVGFKDLKKLTAPVLEAKDLKELTDYLMTDDALIFLVNFISLSVDASINDSEHYVVYLTPEDLLLDDSAEYRERTEYGGMTASYNEKMFLYYADRLGMDKKTAKKMLEDAAALEEKLAAAIPSQEEMLADDYVEKANNPMTYKELEELSGNFPLAELIRVQHLDYDGIYLVSEPDYLKLLNEIYTEDNLEGIRSIVYINALLDLGTYTDREAYDYELDTNNECYGTSYWFTDEESAYDELSDWLSEPLQKLYVDKYGSEEDKKKMEGLCKDVIKNYKEMLSDNTWISEKTLDYALKKLDTMKICALYPESWTDYSGLSLDDCTLYEALLAISNYKFSIEQERPGKTVDREHWAAENDTLDCNAMYGATDNTIYMCLGMMQEPFYSENMSTEELYASIAGFWVGHEISHSFDAEGSRYDADGNLRDWWDPEDKKIFRSRIDKLDDYLDTIVPFEGYHVTGKNIDTEMLADITGLQCALKMAKKEKDFDYDAFFRKFAVLNINLGFYSEELSLLQQDPHPLGYLRTNVSVQQFDELYDTYGIKEGDNMYLSPEERVAVW